jgi:hypothetical protein
MQPILAFINSYRTINGKGNEEVTLIQKLFFLRELSEIIY